MIVLESKAVLFVVIFVTRFIFARSSMRIVLVFEQNQPQTVGWFRDAVRDAEARLPDDRILEDVVALDRNNEDEAYQKLCGAVSRGVSFVLDLTWSEWDAAKLLTDSWDVPHVRSQSGSVVLVLQAMLDLLEARNATDAVVIFKTEADLDQALYNVIGKTILRLLVIHGMTPEQGENLKRLRPAPGNFIIVGDNDFIQQALKTAKKYGLVHLSDRWILTFTDFNYEWFDTSILEPSTTLLFLARNIGCKLQEAADTCSVERDFQLEYMIMSKLLENVLKTIVESNIGLNTNPVKVDCKATVAPEAISGRRKEKVAEGLENMASKNGSLFLWDKEKRAISIRSMYNVQVGNKSTLEDIAKWNINESFRVLTGMKLKPSRTYYRVGIALAIPWTYEKIDPSTGATVLNEKGEPVYEGYCIDFVKKLSEMMDFDYDLVMAKDGDFGKRQPNGTWTGLIGDLASGDTDLAIAATIMTSEREEVVDFVAPYFEQVGISIGNKIVEIGKPLRKTSLFKFMTVLKLEVWLSIVAALSLTAILLSILDRYSPYSARNNKKAYPYPCRDFTLKESFWFALTSFTPQGGGEAPKSLSGRTLVAAYWLFVVLMLATFTANLAAFLTVERMQTPVSSLEQLARQSRIKYTVTENKMAHKYFINMKHAEDTLYRVWKEITLNSSSDQTIYQVWDYPIKEQYGHILLAINSSNPVTSAEEGFRKVNENLDADFAFIHDSAEIKYQVSKNCNFTQVGEVFGERPLAIAVQQGSRFQEDLSKALLELQKERYFESLSEKFWNNSIRGDCDDFDESEGITLESLGGVFIATLFGLALAMVTLVWEVIYYKRKEKQSQKVKSPFKKIDSLESIVKKKLSLKKFKKKKPIKNVTIGETFKPVLEITKPRVSFIHVDPKLAWNP